MAKSIRPDRASNEKEIVELISSGNASPSPRTRKLRPSVIISHRPICSIDLVECFRLGVVITSLMGLMPNSRSVCLLNIPTKTTTVPSTIQKGNMILLPFLLVPPGSPLDGTRQNRCDGIGWRGVILFPNYKSVGVRFLSDNW